MPDTYPPPGQQHAHGFAPGTVAAARRSLQEWSTRPQAAVCLLCGQLVDLVPLLRPDLAARRDRGEGRF